MAETQRKPYRKPAAPKKVGSIDGTKNSSYTPNTFDGVTYVSGA